MTGTATDTTTGVAFDTGTGGSGGSGDNGSGSGGAPVSTSPNGSETGKGGGDAKWFDAVKDPDLKAFAASKNWTDIEASLKSHKELETAFSARGGTAKAPADVSEYKFDLPADLPKEAYNEQFAGQFKQWAKDNDLSVEQAGKIHNSFVAFATEAMKSEAKAGAAALDKSIGDAAKALETAWGKMDTPQFRRQSELARRAISANPGVGEFLKASGALATLDGKTMIASAPIMQLLAKMGGGMYAEDVLHGGGGGSEKNPFDDKTTDLAMQGRIMKEDPNKAAALIRAVGKERMFSQFLERVSAGGR